MGVGVETRGGVDLPTINSQPSKPPIHLPTLSTHPPVGEIRSFRLSFVLVGSRVLCGDTPWHKLDFS